MLEYWFLFPVGVLIGSIAMSSGVSGSNFWIPVYLLWLALEQRVAFWIALVTMLFGFGSGVVRNLRAGTIDWYMVRRHAVAAVPASAVGAAISPHTVQRWLLLAFALFVFGFGIVLLIKLVRQRRGREEQRHERVAWPMAIVAGLLQGAIATGSGAILLPSMLGHRRLQHHATAVGSTVVVVFLCTVVAVLFRLDGAFLETLETQWRDIAVMAAYAGPGAAVGGQLGPRLAQRIPRRHLRLYTGVLLMAIGMLVAARGMFFTGPS